MHSAEFVISKKARDLASFADALNDFSPVLTIVSSDLTERTNAPFTGTMRV